MQNPAKPLVRRSDEGRRYSMGRMSAIFIADEDETNSKLSVSEWWLEPNTVDPDTPHPHKHPEDHLFYVLQGEVCVLLDGEWHSAKRGTYVYIPAGTEHTFENRTSSRAGFISINTPGGFEKQLPGIVEWFNDRSF